MINTEAADEPEWELCEGGPIGITWELAGNVYLPGLHPELRL